MEKFRETVRWLPSANMSFIHGGTFVMGSDKHYEEEQPAHAETVDAFLIDKYAVTNEQFANFVHETGYVTLAERPARAEDYPGAKSERLQPASVVFQQPRWPVDLSNHYNWWTYVGGADWRHPEGPNSSIDNRAQHPVVHIT
jgi:sulfatase modifying factor 1